MTRTPPPHLERKNRFLSLKERKELATSLISETSWGTGDPILAFGAVARAAEKFRISRVAVGRFWKDMKLRFNVDGILSGSPTKFRTGRPSIYSNEDIARAVEEIPFDQRRSIREMANELGVSKSSLGRMIQQKDDDGKHVIGRHSNSLLPLLLPEHKVARVFYAYSKLSRETGLYYAYDQDDRSLYVGSLSNLPFTVNQSSSHNTILQQCTRNLAHCQRHEYNNKPYTARSCTTNLF